MGSSNFLLFIIPKLKDSEYKYGEVVDIESQLQVSPYMIASPIQDDLLPLQLLQTNEEACIVELIGNASQVHRLSEMGLRIGATIRMVRQGAPCLLAIDGKRLSLRLSHDLDVLVAPTPSP